MRLYNNLGYEATNSEIKNLAVKFDLSGISYDFAKDIAAKFSGESPLTPQELRKRVESNIYENPFKFMYKDDSMYVIKGGQRTESFSEAVEYAVEKNLDRYLKLQEYISQLPDCPGDTPLEKALTTLKLLESSVSDNYDYSDTDDEGITLPVPTSKLGKKDSLDDLRDSLEVLKKLEPEDHEVLQSESSGLVEAAKNIDQKWLQIFKVEQFLREKVSSLKLKPTSRTIPDRKGTELRYVSSRKISDLPFVEKKSLLHRSQIGHALLTGKCRVEKKYRKENPVPFVSVLLDNSGSMSTDGKDNTALGVVYYIAKQVAKGNCAAWISLFVTSLVGKPIYVAPGTPIDWFKEFKPSFDDGVTDIARATKQALSEIEKCIEENELNIDTKQKHLILINDGEDDATSLTLEELRPNVLHGFILRSFNDYIEYLCKQTGGSYFTEL